jgi:hypothetical protein
MSSAPLAQLKKTRHAEQRARQRGFQEGDLDLIARLGTATEDGVVLRRRDVDEVRGVLRRLLADLDRLEGSAVIVQDDAIVSVYRPAAKKLKRMLRSKPIRAHRPPMLELRSWQPCEPGEVDES